jgi:hypothetical protein
MPRDLGDGRCAKRNTFGAEPVDELDADHAAGTDDQNFQFNLHNLQEPTIAMRPVSGQVSRPIDRQCRSAWALAGLDSLKTGVLN